MPDVAEPHNQKITAQSFYFLHKVIHRSEGARWRRIDVESQIRRRNGVRGREGGLRPVDNFDV